MATLPSWPSCFPEGRREADVSGARGVAVTTRWGQCRTLSTTCWAPHGPLAHLAVEARVALGAGTLVGPVAVLAGAPVQAGPRVALVDVVLAVAAGEARRTQAGEGVDAVHAGAPVEAGAGGEQAAAGRGERGWGNPLGGWGPDSQRRRDIAWLTSEQGPQARLPPTSVAFLTSRAESCVTQECAAGWKRAEEARTRVATTGKKGRDH